VEVDSKLHIDKSRSFTLTNVCSGFKFLPVLGKYLVQGFESSLPQEHASKWRFRNEYRNIQDEFHGDGSRGGPLRRELSTQEKARL